MANKLQEDVMMHNQENFMRSFRGYTDWDEKTQAQALELLLTTYIREHGLIIDASEFVEILEQYVFDDIAYYEDLEEYEVCAMLKDLLDVL